MERRDPVRYQDISNRQIYITAYVDPGNTDSINVLEHSGFELVGQTRYDESEEKDDRVYILNWEKLYQELDKDNAPIKEFLNQPIKS